MITTYIMFALRIVCAMYCVTTAFRNARRGEDRRDYLLVYFDTDDYKNVISISSFAR